MCKDEVCVFRLYLLLTSFPVLVERLRKDVLVVTPKPADLIDRSLRLKRNVEVVKVDPTRCQESEQVEQDRRNRDCRDTEQLQKCPELPFLLHFAEVLSLLNRQ